MQMQYNIISKICLYGSTPMSVHVQVQKCRVQYICYTQNINSIPDLSEFLQAISPTITHSNKCQWNRQHLSPERGPHSPTITYSCTCNATAMNHQLQCIKSSSHISSNDIHIIYDLHGTCTVYYYVPVLLCLQKPPQFPKTAHTNKSIC